MLRKQEYVEVSLAVQDRTPQRDRIPNAKGSTDRKRACPTSHSSRTSCVGICRAGESWQLWCYRRIQLERLLGTKGPSLYFSTKFFRYWHVHRPAKVRPPFLRYCIRRKLYDPSTWSVRVKLLIDAKGRHSYWFPINRGLDSD